MRDIIAIIVQIAYAYPMWRERVTHCQSHDKTDLARNCLYWTKEEGEDEPRANVVPPLTFGGFIGEEIEWYFYKKKRIVEIDNYTKTRIVIMGILIGSTAFGLRMLGVWFCEKPHVHDPIDFNLFVCFLASLFLWGGIIATWNDN